jgi:hypothetical protein
MVRNGRISYPLSLEGPQSTAEAGILASLAKTILLSFAKATVAGQRRTWTGFPFKTQHPGFGSPLHGILGCSRTSTE